MKVSFSPKDYARLLELVHLGLWTVSAHQGEDTPAYQHYADLEQKLYDLATPFGCADLVDTDRDGSLRPAKKLLEAEHVRRVQDEFTNDTFWNELVNRIADREYAAEQARRSIMQDTPGVEPPTSPEERLKQIEDGLWKHFEKHDLNHIVLLHGRKG